MCELSNLNSSVSGVANAANNALDRVVDVGSLVLQDLFDLRSNLEELRAADIIDKGDESAVLVGVEVVLGEDCGVGLLVDLRLFPLDSLEDATNLLVLLDVCGIELFSKHVSCILDGDVGELLVHLVGE